MNKEKAVLFRPDFWEFILWCFGPVLLPLISFAGMMWIGLFLNLWISLVVPKESDLAFSKLWSSGHALQGLLMVLLPVFLFYLLTICYRLYLRASTRAGKGLIVYGFWLIEIFAVGFFVLLAIGGASMASAEGVASRRVLYGGAAFYSILPIAWSQLFVIPWVFFSVWMMERKKNKDNDAAHS